MTYTEVLEVYAGSDGERTKALYAQLEAIGARGCVAMNLFRAQKCSARAKVYRGGIRGRGSYKSMAYDRKEYSLRQLCAILEQHAGELAIAWGWQRDEETAGYPWVLYVELPTGQVSFHAPTRGAGPDYLRRWDGVPDASPERIIRFCASLFTPVVLVEVITDITTPDIDVSPEVIRATAQAIADDIDRRLFEELP